MLSVHVRHFVREVNYEWEGSPGFRILRLLLGYSEIRDSRAGTRVSIGASERYDSRHQISARKFFNTGAKQTPLSSTTISRAIPLAWS